MKRRNRDHPCTSCGKPTRSLVGICRPCQVAANPSSRRRTSCVECGSLTQAADGVCRSCLQSKASRPLRTCVLCHGKHKGRLHDTCSNCRMPGVELTGGYWSQRGLICVWVRAADVKGSSSPSLVDDRFCMSEPQATLRAAKNEATRTADCSNSRHWPGSGRPHPAKNGSD